MTVKGDEAMTDNAVYKKLQNGSDIRGVAVAGVKGEDVNLTARRVAQIGGAFVTFLAERSGRAAGDLKIAVGHDSRISAPELKEAFLQGLAGQGVAAMDCGLASTPAMFMATVFEEMQTDGAVMLTASHLPYNRNGLKFFTSDGGLEKADIAKILDIAAKEETVPGGAADVKEYNLMGLYTAHLRRLICKELNMSETARPFEGMHIVVDAGNGAGGFFVTDILRPLGANTAGSRFLEPDGMFPNHVPNPEDKAAMASVKEAVLKNRADLGLIFDTDVDRMSAVLADGTEVNRNALIAMMAAILAPDYPKSTIVTDSVTSDELTEFLEAELHLVHHRYMRGYKNVINECMRLNKSLVMSPLAIETSGHGALSENYYLDDGAYLAVKLLTAAAKVRRRGKTLASLIEKLHEPAEACEYRLAISGTTDVQAYGAGVLDGLEKAALDARIPIATPSYEGVRLCFSQGWALLRMSLHDPNMPLNIESREAGGCAKIKAAVYDLLKAWEHLDTTALL